MKPAVLVLLALVLPALPACTRASKAKEAPPAPMAVAFAGCASVGHGPVCSLDAARRLRVWVPGVRPGSLTAADDRGALAPPKTRDVEGGVAFEVTLDEASHELRLEADLADGGRGAWRLRVARDDAPDWLREAIALRREAKLEEAEARLAPGLAPGASDAWRARATALLARLALRQNHLERAASLLREAIRLDRAGGLVSEVGNDTSALAYVLTARQHDTAAAIRALDEAADALVEYPEGRSDELYFRGVAAFDTGDWRGALRSLEQARIAADRLALDEQSASARSLYAVQLQYLGRWREALDQLQALTEKEEDPCLRAVLHMNIGDARLQAAEVGKTDTGDPLPPLEEAIALSRTKCPDSHELGMALANAARAYLLRGDVTRARARFDEARASITEPGAYMAAWLSDVEGRVAMAEKKPAAAQTAFAREEQIGASSFLPVEQWRGASGRAEALEATGARDAAVLAYAAAEHALDAAIAGVPLGEGRESFVADREASGRSLVDLLLRMGRPREALAAARTARARVVSAVARSARLESLTDAERLKWTTALDAYRREREGVAAEAADDWKLPLEELARVRTKRREREAQVRAALDAAMAVLARARPASDAQRAPPPGSLMLAYFPVRTGWAAFAATADRVHAERIELPDHAPPDRLGAALFGPFHAEIDAAREILILPHGAVRAIDLHALPYDGAPLVAHAPVRYVLDVSKAAAPEDAAATTALVVADPTSDLKAAREEGERVRGALAASSRWQVRTLVGPQATAAAFARELGSAALLHYAGHGVYAGREGWDSALPLAAGARFGIGDVLALGRVPGRVVLSTCEGARSSAEAAEGLGIAQGFIVAGARVVVAPTRPVKDELAAALALSLYEALAKDDSLVTALRSAQQAIGARMPDADWAAFRALTP